MFMGLTGSVKIEGGKGVCYDVWSVEEGLMVMNCVSRLDAKLWKQ